MIFVIALGVLTLLGIGLFISGFLEVSRERVYIYDEKGDLMKYSCDIDDWRGWKGQDSPKDERLPCICKVKRSLEWNSCYDLGDNARGVLGLILGMLSLIAFMSTGIFCIVANGPVNQNTLALNVECEIEKLQNKENTLHLTLAGDLGLTVTDTTSTYHVVVDKPIEIKTAIDSYNNDVLSLKKDLYTLKIKSDSPWFNWFTNPGFKNVEHYNANATSYKDILGDSLKTFELSAN